MLHHKNAFYATLAKWLPLGITIVVLSGLIYVAVQQNYRLSANDPQIQVAEDVTTALSTGNVPPGAVVSPNPTTELSSSLATFLVIYSATGTPIGSSVALNGKLPEAPQEALTAALKTGKNIITWQPQPKIRIAAVIASFKSPTDSGYVLVGRSLREVENRIQQLAVMTASATALALVLTFLVMFYYIKKEHETVHHAHGEAEITTTVKLD